MKRTCYRRMTIAEGHEKNRCLEELHDFLLEAHRSEYAEIWVDHGDYPALCALVHGDCGWLMYLRYDGDAGFSSRNVQYPDPVDAVIDYYLSNGQRDEYPTSWTLSKNELFNAIEWFATNRSSPTGITWFNNSGDGNLSPNDDFVILD